VPETLVPASTVSKTACDVLHDADVRAEFEAELRGWIGRPTPLTYAHELSRRWGADVWLKREDLAHTGAHKINNAIGQALLAKRLGAKRIVAETGAGQHGVASAAACARSASRASSTWARRRRAAGAERRSHEAAGRGSRAVHGGDQTLRAAIDEALRDWVSDPNGTYYLLGSAVGPHPYPYLGARVPAVIGIEARAQMLDATGSCRTSRRVRGRRLERDRSVSPVRRRSQREVARARGRWHR
jgi:tryptophan synthase beta chain